MSSDDALDRIELTGISATGYHGVFDSERRDGQRFVADVVMHVDTRPAAAADDLTLTVDYGAFALEVAAVLGGPPVDLIETVAERIAARALVHPLVAAVEVRVHKPQAPVTVPFTDVAVVVRRDRVRRAVVPAYEEVAVADVAASAPVPPADPLLEPAADPLDRRPAAPVDVVLALGANLGNPQETLRHAIADLAEVAGLEVTAIAPLARTGPVGGPEQPDYLNTVVLASTVLSPRALLRACQRIEVQHGRVRAERWGARTLDIDLVVYGSTTAAAEDLELPHPRAHERAFVLEPWAQVAPDAVLPGLGGGPVAALARTAPDRDGIRWLALDWWSQPTEPR